MTGGSRTYLALGDSMSIDLYTGVRGGGAVSQFCNWLGPSWSLDDRTVDMCRMRYVPASAKGNLITMTIGGNDLLADQARYLKEGVDSFAQEHLELLRTIRTTNPNAFIIVGNVYAPQMLLPDHLLEALQEANAAIASNAEAVSAYLADIHQAFCGHEKEYLCYDIEPSLKGATVIAGLFKNALAKAGGR